MAKVSAVKVDYPGLVAETLPSGNIRYRVRVEGNPRKRIPLHVPPGHRDFSDHYHAARSGIEIKPDTDADQKAIRGSLAWLTYRHLAYLEKRVEDGLTSPGTFKKRDIFLRMLRSTENGEFGERDMLIPTKSIIELRDDMAATPAMADDMVSAIRVMYRWAIDRGIVVENPAISVGKIDRGKGGATPWTVGDLKQYREAHRKGTTAHLFLTLLMFTACRIGDSIRLGRSNEFKRDGVRGLGWQPEKKGSAYVEIPMLPPLYEATRAATVQGSTYLLNDYGKPFASASAMGHKLKKWTTEAGLTNRTAHGVRKAAGHLLAEQGCTQYQIMCIHGHTEAKTSEVYTKGVQRWKLATDAMATLNAIEW